MTLKGDDVINRVYSDGHDSIGAACRAIGIPQELSQPGVPQNNGIIENKVGDELAGIRTQLCQAGFPLCLWPYAARVYATLENTRVREDGNSPWFKRFGERPDFKRLPLGCKVWFIPAPTILEDAKVAPRLITGISLAIV